MAKIRPKNTPSTAAPAADDRLLLDGVSGVRSISDVNYKTAIAAAFVAAPSTFKLATLDGTNKVPTTQLPASISGGLVYKGTLAGASVPATSTAEGDYYVIVSAGTSQTITWAVGDLAIYTGVSGAWDQVSEGTKQVAQGGTGGTTPAAARTNLDIASNSEVLARDWSMAGHVKFDGDTSGQRASAFIPGLNIGLGDFTACIAFRVPTDDPSSPGGLFGIGAATTYNAQGGLGCVLTTGGNLQIMLCAANGSNIRVLYFTDFVTAYAGRAVRLTLARAAGTFAIYVNGVDITASFAETTVGTPPASMAETISGQYINLGCALPTDLFDSSIYCFDLFNYALTASAVAELVNFGITSENRWGSTYGMNAVLNQERNALFTGTATDWAAYVTGSPAIDTTNDELDVTVSSGGDGVTLTSAYLAQLKSGQRYRLLFAIRNFSTVTSIDATFNNQAIGTVTADGDFNFEFVPTAGVGALTFAATDAGSFSLTNIKLEPVLLGNGNFETAGGGGADVFGSWSETTPGTSAIAADAVVFHSGAKSAKLTFTTGNTPYLQQLILVPGMRYRVDAWFRHDKGSNITGVTFFGAETAAAGSTLQTTDYAGTAFDIVSETWTHVVWDFTAMRANFGLTVAGSMGDGKSAWWDDVTLTPIGSALSLSPWGLDKDTTLWRNQALTGDATIFSTPQIICGPARFWADENMLTQISREHRALAGGGVYFDGNASQRVNVNLTTAQDIDTTAFWNRLRFTVPTSNPAANRLLSASTSSSSGAAAGASVTLQVTTSGNLNIIAYGSTTSDYRIASVQDFVSRYSGKVVNLVICRTATAGLLIWVNGIPSAFVESVSGTPPTWGLDVTSTYIFAPVTHIGEVFTWQLGRGTLTDALVAELTSTGIRTASGSAISKGGKFSATAADGVVLDLDFSVGCGQQFPDRSGNNFHGNSNHTTHTHLTPRRSGQVRGRTAAASSIQLNGAVCIPTNAVITSINITSAGTPTIDIGTVGSGEQIVKDWTLAASGSNFAHVEGANGAALVTRKSSPGNLYITSTTADQLDIVVNYELMD